jgi:hypothetical protein
LSAAKAGFGVVPLHSTRADAEHLLKVKPQRCRGNASLYDLPDKTVIALYAAEPTFQTRSFMVWSTLTIKLKELGRNKRRSGQSDYVVSSSNRGSLALPAKALSVVRELERIALSAATHPS